MEVDFAITCDGDKRCAVDGGTGGAVRCSEIFEDGINSRHFAEILGRMQIDFGDGVGAQETDRIL